MAPQTLYDEVRLECFEKGGYPTKWERHSPCPCCGQGPLRPAFAKTGIMHAICGSCDFVCVDPYPPEDVLKRLYEGRYYSLTRELYEVPRMKRDGAPTAYTAPVELLEDIAANATAGRPNGAWFDAGGGVGAFASMIEKQYSGWSVSLNEFNPRSVELAKELFGLKVEAADVEAIAATGRKFDVVSAIAVLEHIVQPLSFVQQYASLLKPRGTFVVVVPNFTPLLARVSKGSSAVVAPPFHVSLFNELNIRTLFERSGKFDSIIVDDFGPAAFTLLQHADYGDSWDIHMPTDKEPQPKGFQKEPYSFETSVAISALAEADTKIGGDFFAKTDGRTYLRVVARTPSA